MVQVNHTIMQSLNTLTMKKIFLITATLFIATATFAQGDQTLFSDVDRVGAFGAPFFDYTDLSGDVNAIGGGGGALVLDDFFLGGFGIGTYELSKLTDEAANIRQQVRLNHGGFWIGYVPIQHRVLHPYTSLRIGWGKARFREIDIDEDQTLDSFDDNIFVLTPEAGFELNVFSFFRIAATAHYRIVNGLDQLENFSDDDLSGFGASLTLRFGGFGGWD